MKQCKQCGQVKPLEAFYRASGMRDGHRNECKRCNLAAKRQRYQSDPEAAKARVKRWQQENADRVNAYRRVRRTEPEVKRAERAGHLKRKYGITIGQYETMVESQSGGCAICGTPPTQWCITSRRSRPRYWPDSGMPVLQMQQRIGRPRRLRGYSPSGCALHGTRPQGDGADPPAGRAAGPPLAGRPSGLSSLAAR